MIEKIISGGQTGVDRAGLDVAIEKGIPHGGWVPKGRKAEDGQVPAHYTGMTEHPMSGYPPRTEANVQAADATLIFTQSALNDEPGCLLTVKLCREHQKPFQVISIKASDIDGTAEDLVTLLLEWKPKILNIAGTRGSRHPDVGKVKRILSKVLEILQSEEE